jgi:vacuolar protein sorting-associated protein 13A/C
VTSAFEGVAAMPMEGAEKGGAAGFARGVGKGFVGLFTKPVVGVMDFISASTEGIRNTTTVFDTNAIDRVRLPRFIANDAVLRPYSAREALGQSWLKDLDAGAYFSESYVAHLDIPGDDAVAILSSNRLLYVQLRRMRVIWQVSFDELQSLSLEASGIALVLRGGTPGPFLPIGEQTGREWFFRKIAKVVEAYNKSHSARDDVG